MTKDQLIDTMAQTAGIAKTQANKALDSFIETVKTTLKKGDTLTLTGFGTFKTSKRSARQGINPKTGEKIQIKAAIVPKFSAGKTLKDAFKK
ncbi:MAG: HU family DNA-binding protein [Candidatus Wildermuthbacteria bacterium]|nr:HU family DNA-binding protein [Candidatus Wildermuthbacteria bacterium]